MKILSFFQRLHDGMKSIAQELISIKTIIIDQFSKTNEKVENLSASLRQLGNEQRILNERMQGSSDFLGPGNSRAGYIGGPGTPITFNADGLISIHNADFLTDPKFVEAERLGMATPSAFSGAHLEWRIFVCCWAAAHAKHLGGDFVECGVNSGIFSRAVMSYIDFIDMKDCRFFLLDTFCGIDISQMTNEEIELGLDSYNRWYPECYEQALQTFSSFNNAVIIRGRIPDTLPQIASERIAYVSMDLNCAQPEIAAGEYLWPRMLPGAVVVLDDYGFRAHVMQKRAWDDFAAARGLKILALPTGQGLLIKP